MFAQVVAYYESLGSEQQLRLLFHDQLCLHSLLRICAECNNADEHLHVYYFISHVEILLGLNVLVEPGLCSAVRSFLDTQTLPFDLKKRFRQLLERCE